MYVVGIKFSDDPSSVKIAYTKHGKVYVRSGADDFITGRELQGSVEHLYNRYGYKHVIGNPSFKDRHELLENITRFSMNNKGTVEYI